jgi:hypothetical protein
MIAMMSLQDVGPIIEANGFVTVSEPACGAGGMVLATAGALQKKAFDLESGAPGRRTGPAAAGLGPLFLGCFVRLCCCILGFCSGVFLVVARHSFRNLFSGKLAVFLRMQYLG